MALVLDLLRRVLQYFGWPSEQAVFLESGVFGGSISRAIRTCLPSAATSRRRFQQLHAVVRKYQVKAISVCQKKKYGSTRSVVRRLGTILSLEPYPRPCFQLVQEPSPLGYDEQSTAPRLVAPSLADVLWVANALSAFQLNQAWRHFGFSGGQFLFTWKFLLCNVFLTERFLKLSPFFS